MTDQPTARSRRKAAASAQADLAAASSIEVSGRYQAQASTPQNYLNVRVDVDRLFPQARISIEVATRFPTRAAHVIAEKTSDTLTNGVRKIVGKIVYRDGDANLIPGDEVQFEASGAVGNTYSNFRLNLVAGGATLRSISLAFQSPYFDDVEFELDTVTNSAPITSYKIGSHPNCPQSIAHGDISLVDTFQRAGFNARISPNPSAIPITGAGQNATWSDQEMHNAMVAYWSRFANRPDWALWVLFAAQHDEGDSLGGVMFDDIGPNHRQGTAIFTNSFIARPPQGDADGDAWVQRMIYWTAVHEMGHAFNLAHSWQKSLAQGPLGPWVPLEDEHEVRSFMNYPFRVNGGEQRFFADFEFKFSDSELCFMRHAPRRFVQMGNEDWFKNHAFEQHDPTARFQLELRPNRDGNTFRFLEPVMLELKLTNTSPASVSLHENPLSGGHELMILVKREGSPVKRWRPFLHRCDRGDAVVIDPKSSIYASYLMGATTSGWLIDEPGLYSIQAAVVVDGDLVTSNTFRLVVEPPLTRAEATIAPDFFVEDVARVIAFKGCPSLGRANDVLREVQRSCPDNPAAIHATVALSAPLLQDYKILQVGRDRRDIAFAVRPQDVERAARAQVPVLTAAPQQVAQTMGHIDYRSMVEKLTSALSTAGERGRAVEVQQAMVDTMTARGVAKSVLAESRAKLAEMG